MKFFNKENKDEAVQAKLITFNPKEVSEITNLAKHLLDDNAIIIDFSNTPSNVSIRIVDYISGMLMVTKGDYRKLGKKIYLISNSKEVNDHYEEQIKHSLVEDDE